MHSTRFTRVKKILKHHYLTMAAALIATGSIGYITINGIDFVPGNKIPSAVCETDLGEELGRHGHSEEFVWKGCLIANDTARMLSRFIPKGQHPDCVDCHDGKQNKTLARLWTEFPKIDRHGEAIDMATAIRREVIARYKGIPPNKADNTVTSLYFYMAAKAKQDNLYFEIEPPGAQTTLGDVDKKLAEPRCAEKFDEKGWPAGSPAKHVVEGCNLIVNTRAHMRGPIAGSWPTGMNCESCHRHAGDLVNASSIAHGAVVLPHMMTSMNQPVRFDRRILMCFARSMNSFDLGLDAKEIVDLNFYANWLAQKEHLPIGVVPEGRGIPLLYDTQGKGQSFLAGELVYETYCKACHGFAGTGGREWMNGAIPPPIAGPNSFNKTASISSPFRMAGFVHANMPPGATREHPFLTEQQALDVAAYLTQLGRAEDFTKKNPVQVFSNWIWIRIVNTITVGLPKESNP
ncbi:MAG: c-type cytochrome [Sideroxyarcus sp.]|nr:c-type cytochrome [Sideroxyarcus sp.]